MNTVSRRIALLVVAHLALGVVLLVTHLGTPALMDDSPFLSVGFLAPFAVGALVAGLELALLPLRTVSFAWLGSWVAIQALCIAGFVLGTGAEMIGALVGREPGWSTVFISPILVAYTVSAMSIAALVVCAIAWLGRRLAAHPAPAAS